MPPVGAPIPVQIVAEPSKWLGETVGFWIQTLMLAVAAAAGIWAIVSRGKEEGRRSTMDLIIEQKRDAKLTEARALMHKMRRDGLQNLSQFVEMTDGEQYKAILVVLNAYEFLAAGVRAGVFSDTIYKRLRYTQLLEDWMRLQGFITELRVVRGKPTLFQDFEWLYQRWKDHPLT